jgi:hypothetical protein
MQWTGAESLGRKGFDCDGGGCGHAKNWRHGFGPGAHIEENGSRYRKSEKWSLTFAQTESKVAGMNKRETKMGRPPKPPAEKMSHRVCVRLTPEQFRRLVNRAKQAGLSLSAFIQKRLED